MSRAFDPINLANLPAPQVITPVSAEQEKADLLGIFQHLYPDYDVLLESDPAFKLIEAFAYRLAIEKQRRNEAIQGVMLAYARGTDLDQLGANLNVQRLVVKPADNKTIPPTSSVMESDEDFRQRIQLSFEGYATAGSVGSYVFFARSADGNVGDVQVISPAPGQIVLYIMAREGNGEASPELLERVNKIVNADEVRPLTDHVTVQSVTVVPYSINAVLDLYSGPDADVVQQNARAALVAYCQQIHKIGYMVATSGIYAALQQPGVRHVSLTGWEGDLDIKDGQVGFCENITLTIAEAAHD